jgi:tRNA nucleotidyltransferase (CCA-adding enzyme)
MPEVDAVFGVPVRESPPVEVDLGVHDLGVHLARSLDWAADHGYALPARYGVLAHNLGPAALPRDAWPAQASMAQNVRLAESVSERLKVPLISRDAARLAARWRPTVQKSADLRPAQLLDLLHATDALRRPGRLERLLEVCTAEACSRPGAAQDYPPAQLLREALAVARSVNAGALARKAVGTKGKKDDDAIATAVRAARRKALRAWRRAKIS